MVLVEVIVIVCWFVLIVAIVGILIFVVIVVDIKQ